MVAGVTTLYTQFVTKKMEQTLSISSIECAQLRVQQHLDSQIRNIYEKHEAWKLEGLIASRDARLHVNAHSLPSLTVKKKKVIFSHDFNVAILNSKVSAFNSFLFFIKIRNVSFNKNELVCCMTIILLSL